MSLYHTKGLLVFTMRPARGTPDVAITTKHDQFVLLGMDATIFTPCDRNPALYLSHWMGMWIATPEPVTPSPAMRVRNLSGWARGHCAVYTSDSRFQECVGHSYPIPVYDTRMY